MNDLEWIARHLHEWPERYNKKDSYGWHRTGDGKTPIFVTYNQWIAERARLQNKPSWSDAPEWAEWLFQNERGNWVWFEKEPKFTKENIDFKGEVSENKGELLGYYRDTLERRPEQMTPPTHTNHRCVQVTIENQEWDGEGLPPVWVRIQAIGEHNTEWFELEIVAIRDGNAWIIDYSTGCKRDYIICLDSYKFRPLLTEEQKAISEIETMINKWLRKEDGAEKLAKKIYKRWVKNQDAAE